MKTKLFRILSAVMVLATLVSVVLPGLSVPAKAVSYSGSSSYKSGKFYTQLTNVSLTGDQRTDIVNIAKSQIGYQEGSNSSELSGTVYGGGNYTEYGRWYGMQDMWCAMFVSWCAGVAGVSTSVVPKHAYTPSGLQWFNSQGRAYTREAVVRGEYTPKAGDIIYFKSARNSNITNHVGIVTSYSNGTVHTIEGNTSSATISTNGGAVCAKSYSIYDTYIVYVCAPAYKTNGSGSSASSLIPAELKSVVFNADYYASKYSDLKSAFGNDAAKLYDHFLTNGIKEGRQASPIFDVQYYLNSHGDLKAAYGTDYVKAMKHFVAFGIDEYRLTAKPVNLGTSFYAKLTGVGSGKNLSLSDDNVIIYPASKKPAQVWKFTRQLDGSYTIQNQKTGKLLAVENSATTNGANVQTETANTGSNQCWYIYNYNGNFVLRPTCASGRVLEVGSGKTDSGANVQIYSFNGTGAQKFKITKTEYLPAVTWEDIGSDFYAKISVSSNSDLSLSLSGSGVVLQSNNTSADQIWKFERQSDGSYKIINQKDGKSVLDVNGAKSSAGGAIQIYADNGSSAQRWYIYLKEGAYILRPGCSSNVVLDVKGGALRSGTALQTYGVNGTPAQSFTIIKTDKPEENKFSGMTVGDIGTDFIGTINWPTGGFVLDVSGTNVQTAVGSRVSSQYWRFIRNENGTYKILNQNFGLVLEVADSSNLSGANIRVGKDTGAAGQQWYVYKVDGKVVLRPASSTQFAMDVKGGSKVAGANIHQYTYNATAAQMFTVTQISNYLSTVKPENLGNFFANIATHRGLYLGLSGTAVTQQTASKSTSGQLWKFVRQSDGNYYIINLSNNKALDIVNGTMANNSKIQVYTSNGTTAQKWLLFRVDGQLVFVSAKNNQYVMDIPSDSKDTGRQMQVYAYNGSKAQMFTLQNMNDKAVTYSVTSPYNTNSIGTYTSLDQAKSVAKSKQQLGYVVYDSNGAFVYSPASSLDASRIVWEAKWVADYSKANNYNYGHAQINPAISAGTPGCEKLSSCDRFVGWALYRAGWTDQPYKYGFTSDFCSYLRSKGFTTITNPKDLLPGDIVFVGYAGQPEPYGHVFLYAGASSNGNHYRYDAGSVERIRCIGAYASYNSTGQPFNQGLELSSNRLFRIAYRCPATNKGYSSADSTVNSNALGLTETQKNMVFDAEYYRNNNADLKAAFGEDETKLYNHFLNYGIKEGRQGNAVFNVKYYLSANADLKAAYGTDYVKAMKHYLSYGYKEHRVTAKPVDLGTNFYANVTVSGTKLNLAASASNVVVNSASSGLAQVWKFVRQSDGSYCLINQQNDQAMDVASGVATSGANVQLYTANGTRAQKWYIYQVYGGYVLRSACSGGCVLDLAGGSKKDNTNVQHYTYNGTTAQKFTITKVELDKSQVVYYVASPYNTNRIGTYSDLNQAKSVAKSKQQLGYVVYDSNGAFVYSPASSLDASRIVWEAKWVADYQKANNYNYGHAQINPAISAGTAGCEKLSSCDRFVGWALYRAGWTDQPYKYGFTSDFCTYLRNKGFTVITNPNDLLPGDIVFVGYAGQPEPYGHVFLYAGASSNGNHYRYDAGSVDRIRCVGAYASYNSTGQPFNQALELSSNRLFRIAYRCPATNKGYSSSDVAGSDTLILTDSQKAMVFDAEYYSSNNADLKAAFGTDATKLYNHFLNFGIKEGRQGNAVFDIKYYLSANADLKAAYGTDYVRGMKHYLSYGYKEQRVTAKPVDLGTNFYAKINISGTSLNLSLSDTNVIAYTASDKPAQVWRFVRGSDGSYTIINQKTGMALDVDGSSSVSGANVQIYKQDGTKAQKWNIYQTSGGYVLRAVCSGGGVLDLAGGSKTAGTNIRQYTYNGTTAQKYSIVKVDYLNTVAPENLGDSFYAKITAVGNTNMNLSLSENNVILYTNSSKPAQVWKFERQSDGSYKIINQKDGQKVLDVSGASSKSGANVQIYADNGSAAQRWFIYVKEGNYVLRPGCSTSTVLDITNGVMSDMTNIQTYTLDGTIAQSLKIVKTDKPGETADSDMEVLRKIIYAVETGGQVYGNARYDAFTEAYANTELEHAITIGAGQWFANEAKRLLNLIRETDPAGFAALDTEGIAYDLDNCDWSTYKVSADSAKAKCIQKIISSPAGIQCQDYLIDEQMKQYLEEAKALGVTDLDAQMMCANLRHLGGLSAVKRVLGKTYGGYTMDNIYAALQSDTGNQVGTFRSRNLMVYNTLKKYISK